MLQLIFDPNYEKNSRKVTDQRIFSEMPRGVKVAKRKFEFLRNVGMHYPSLNAKKLSNKEYQEKPLWEFYITRKWRCFFTYNEEKEIITIVKIGNHL